MTLISRTTQILVVCALSASAHAAFPDLELSPAVIGEEVARPTYPNSNAIAVAVGEASLYPSARFRVGSTDNVFLDVSDNTAVDSTRLSFSPQLNYIALGAKQMLWLGYLGDYATHNDAEQADYDDHRLSLVSHTAFDSRRRLDIEATISQSHQDIGLARTTDFTAAEIVALSEVDTFRQNKLGASFSYGNPATKGELVFGYAFGDIEFTSNEAETAQYDRDFSVAWSRLYYRLSPDTRVYGELSYRALDYDTAFATDGRERDAANTAALLGIIWDTSGLWYGAASIGTGERDYDDAGLTDSSTVLGDVSLTWLVKSYSQVVFQAGRREFESTLGDGLAETTTYSVRWLHDWSDRVSSSLRASSVSSKESDGSLDSDYSQASAQLVFAPRRWLRFSLGALVDDISKSSGNADRMQTYFGVEANL
ncbi:MAG: outer membrane beta-barrel protein [Pseudomonadota bacterium]